MRKILITLVALALALTASAQPGRRPGGRFPRPGLSTCRLGDSPTWSKSPSRPVAKSPPAATLCVAAFLLQAEPPALAIAVLRRLTSARRLCYASIRRTAHGPTSLPRFSAGSHGSKARSGKRSGKTKEPICTRRSIRSPEIWTISTGRLVARLRRKARLSSDFLYGPSRASGES